ncbi:hypothetical protein [Gracilibacillus salinarum]|uniref:Uncharacterized protein n=1 Tax=Gracilibacillus salinarum TaxID=2932255 RepID=A0ABY4GT67_9BACI|nr:hypothetical protein [Gracilibacillus salinarum]UOQ87582.1 hypothetical protein MUN87_02460 [Gracilibacillus salinarum]
MTDEFKKKLEAYEKGELSEDELDAFEEELDKIEKYQEHLQENDYETLEHKVNPDKSKKQKKNNAPWEMESKISNCTGCNWVIYCIHNNCDNFYGHLLFMGKTGSPGSLQKYH